MASSSSGSATAPTDVSIAQPARNPKRTRAAPEEWPALLRRCVELDITARDLDLEHETIEAAIEAIEANTGKKAPTWQKAQRNKLRKRVQRAITDAQPAEPEDREEDAGAEAAAAEAASEPASERAAEPQPVAVAPAAPPPAEHWLYSGQTRALDDLELELELEMHGTRHRGRGAPQPLSCLEYRRAEIELSALQVSGARRSQPSYAPASPD
jgi:hypothetical protein